MKAILFSLILAFSPAVALANTPSPLDARTQEILEKRFCQYLKSGWTPGEAIKATKYAVEQNYTRETGPGSELMDIFIRHRPNIISRPKVSLVKEYNRIKMILIASYFFSKIELARIDIHFSH
jgi:hypothetical protein